MCKNHMSTKVIASFMAQIITILESLLTSKKEAEIISRLTIIEVS